MPTVRQQYTMISVPSVHGVSTVCQVCVVCVLSVCSVQRGGILPNCRYSETVSSIYYM